MNDKGSEVVLASSSPQRLTLLRQILPTTKIVVHPTDIDEERFHELGPKSRCSQLAHLKAKAAAELFKGNSEAALIIGADTEVVFRGIELGKPKDELEARAMLESLRGASHEVVTGVSVFHQQLNQWIDAAEVTTVQFRRFSKSTLEAYIQANEWQGKSGAYASQGMGVLLTSGIRGSHSNVVGLPLEKLSEILFEGFNFDPR
ncbi:UNVERIFIED_CONTAM: hypothetical protein GTU68_047454 [Idotea baltica]|nr:hypothetical protein [Idotea baltica]